MSSCSVSFSLSLGLISPQDLFTKLSFWDVGICLSFMVACVLPCKSCRCISAALWGFNMWARGEICWVVVCVCVLSPIECMDLTEWSHNEERGAVVGRDKQHRSNQIPVDPSGNIKMMTCSFTLMMWWDYTSGNICSSLPLLNYREGGNV